jgi:lysozyme
MRTNSAGLSLIKEFEGCQLKAYLCPAGVWTIGYGSTWNVQEGLEITQAEANARLVGDVESTEIGITRFIKVRVGSNPYSACVALAFNIGVMKFRESTLLKFLNQGCFKEASEQFLVWNKIRKGSVLVKSAGLTRRREAEKALFLKRDV